MYNSAFNVNYQPQTKSTVPYITIT